MLFQPEIETLPLAKLRLLQDKRLAETIARVYHQVPHYKNAFDIAGIKPADIKGVEDIHKLPFTYKSTLRDNYPFGLFAVAQDDIIRIHASSGTTGKLTVVGYNKHDIEVFSEVVARSLVAGGARPGMTLHNAYGYGLFTGGLGIHYGAEKLGMRVVPVSGGMTERQLMLLQDFKAEVICCTPSYALSLSEQITLHGITSDSLNLKYALLGAEPWTESIRKKVEEGMQLSATNIYGLSEIIGPGVSQEAVEEKGSGSTIWEDHFYPEVVDKDSGEPLPYGEYGVLVFTTLSKQAMPLLRYWTNDICCIYYDEHSQRTHIKMSPIIGRADDMLIIRGVNVFPTQIETQLQHIHALSNNYQLILSRDGSMDELLVEVEIAEEFMSQYESMSAGLAAQLSKQLKDHIGISIKTKVLAHNSLPRSEGGKTKRVIDQRTKQV
jgi:phenylacetate-CoA ligase